MVKTKIPHEEGLFFITFTCYRWLPLFEVANAYSAVYNWFNILKGDGHKVAGYVIMPNHLHALLSFVKAKNSINTIIGTGKRFMAYDIVKRLKALNQSGMLETMIDGVVDSDALRGKRHCVWIDSFDWKHCYDERITLQKLKYIHNNPCAGKWNLVDRPSQYLHSSARYYETGEQGLYPITHYLDL